MKVKSNQEIFDFIKPYADSQNIELVEVEMKPGKNPSLTIYVDTEDGIDLVTLEKFHNLINDPLDEFDPTFNEPYTLNVSSPGLDRPFKTERDFMRHLGEKVEVKLYAPIKGNKYFEGVLTAFDENTVTILIGDKEEKFEKSRIAKVNVAIEFDW